MNRSTSGADLPTLRSHNTALVLELLRVAGDGGISRLELAERTGLTPQAVSKITARLREDGLVAEAGRRPSTGGKPRTVLRLVPEARSAVGLHLDRDRLTAVLTDLAGETVAVRTVPFDFGAGAERVLDAAVAHVRALLRDPWGHGPDSPVQPPARTAGPAAGPGGGTACAADHVRDRETGPAVATAAEHPGRPAAGHTTAPTAHPGRDSAALPPVSTPAPGPGTPYGPVLGVGVACPGPLDHRTGVLGRVTGAPRWDGYPLRDRLAARLGLPVTLDKDTNAAALGLALRGAAARTCGAESAAVRGRLAQGSGVTGTPACAPAPAADGVSAAPAGAAAPATVVPAAAAAQAGRAGTLGESFAYLHLGTGLGAGLVLDGGLYRGSRTGAGEFGHQVIQLDGPPCPCGNRGCVEALCLAAVARGDHAEAARILGTGVANLAGLLDIDRVLLGGRIAVAHAEVFARGVEAMLEERAVREGAGMLAGAGAGTRTGAVAAAGADAGERGRASASTGPAVALDTGTVIGTGGGRRVRVAVVDDAEPVVARGAAYLILAPLFGHTGSAESGIVPSDRPDIR